MEARGLDSPHCQKRDYSKARYLLQQPQRLCLNIQYNQYYYYYYSQQNKETFHN